MTPARRPHDPSPYKHLPFPALSRGTLALAGRVSGGGGNEIRTLKLATPIPQFWLGTGTGNKQDVANAELFWQPLSLRQASVPLILTRGGGHDMTTWRAEVPAMLAWMTPRLAQAAALEAAAQSPHPRPSGSAAPRHHRQARHPALAAQRASVQHSS